MYVQLVGKHVPASAAIISTSSNLCEPAISGITAVVSAQTLLSAMRQSLWACKRRCQPAATYRPLGQLVRCTTPTRTMILGTSRNCVIRRYNKPIHSKHFITEKRSGKVTAAAICRVQHSDVTILCSAWSGKLSNLFTVLFQCNVLRIRLAQTPCSTHCLQAKLQQPQQQTNLRIRKYYF